MRFADDWQTVIGTALALLGGKSASVSQSSAPEMSADDNSAYSVSSAWTVRSRTFVPDTIVIVEDEEAISLFWGDCLREAGFDVQAFSDATGYDERRYPGACAADPLLCILGKPFEEPYVPAGVAH